MGKYVINFSIETDDSYTDAESEELLNHLTETVTDVFSDQYADADTADISVKEKSNVATLNLDDQVEAALKLLSNSGKIRLRAEFIDVPGLNDNHQLEID